MRSFHSEPNRRRVLVVGDECPLVESVARRLHEAGLAVEAIEPASPSLAHAVRSHTDVVNLVRVLDPPSGSIGHGLRFSRRRHRRKTLATLAEALATAPTARLVQRSSSSLYSDGGDAWIDEGWPVESNSATREVTLAERLAALHRQRGGTAVVIRLAPLAETEDHHSDPRRTLARRGWEPFEGPPDAYFPLVRLADAANAFVAALEAPSATFNVASAELYTNRELNAHYSNLVTRRLEPLYSSVRRADRALLDRSHRLNTSAFRHATAWQPQPTFGSSADTTERAMPAPPLARDPHTAK